MKRRCMTRPWTFICMPDSSSRLSIASVDGKQHLSEVVLSVLIGFSVYWKWSNDLVYGMYLYTQDQSPVIMVFMKSESLFVESSMSCESWIRKSSFSLQWKSNKSTKNTLLKCCLPLTDAVDSRGKFTHAYGGWKSPHTSALHWNPPGFRKKKVGYFYNRLALSEVFSNKGYSTLLLELLVRTL